jgi:YD repeat-containing protein
VRLERIDDELNVIAEVHLDHRNARGNLIAITLPQRRRHGE